VDNNHDGWDDLGNDFIINNFGNYNFNNFDYKVKKSFMLSNTSVPQNSKVILRATDYFELSIGITVPLGSELTLAPEENHCYENAIAERVNGILKDEFYLDQCFFDSRFACKAAKNTSEIYNSKRLHISLGFRTPNSVFKNVA